MMNKQVKEQLQNLLDIIDKLCERQEYDWFKKELIKRFGGNEYAAETSSVLGSVQVERINNIESYLALDREIDDRESLIDYSFIQDKNVREQLIQDNREMRRYRLGLRGHKVNFDEFCRYALLQVEMLLNYYYYIRFSDNIENIKNSIKSFYPKLKEENTTSIITIPLYAKIAAFCKEFNLKKIKTTLTYTKDVRNTLSHRSPTKKEDIKTLQAELLNKNVFYDNSTNINWENSMDEDTRNKANKFQYLMWLDNEPCNDVVDKLKQLSSIIKSKLY